MKKLIIILFLLIPILGFGFNKKHIPSKAKEYIKVNYPSVKFIRWGEIRKEKLFEAYFICNKKEVILLFSEDGNWLQSQKQITYHELSDSVKYKLNKKLTFIDITEIKDSCDNVSYYIIAKESKKIGIEINIKNDGSMVESKNTYSRENKGILIGIIILAFSALMFL